MKGQLLLACSITDYQGRVVRGSRSRGSGVFAAFNWRDMVLNPGPEIIRKASQKARLSDFPPEDQEELAACLGHYSPVQSANSEDTVTWSVFGASPLQAWLPGVLAEVFDEPLPSSPWSARFWQRQAHPDTGDEQRGPESEITLLAGKWCIEVEAKWLSDLDGRQGKTGNKSQVDMRAHTARQNSGPDGKYGVLIVAPSPQRYPPSQRLDSVFRRYFDIDGDSYACRDCAAQVNARVITWESIADVLDRAQPLSSTAAYLRWRLELIG